MAKRVTVLFIAVTLCVVSSAFADRGSRFRHADRNDDGQLDRKEIQMEKQWERNQTKKVDSWWENRADTDNNGVVSNEELQTFKKLESEHIDANGDGEIDAKERRRAWVHGRSKVNTVLENKYDLNADGWLEVSEARELLKDKYALIVSDGKAKVDTPIEEEYDANRDGIIDKAEAEAIAEDIKE